jgi:hypothetical protein
VVEVVSEGEILFQCAVEWGELQTRDHPGSNDSVTICGVQVLAGNVAVQLSDDQSSHLIDAMPDKWLQSVAYDALTKAYEDRAEVTN